MKFIMIFFSVILFTLLAALPLQSQGFQFGIGSGLIIHSQPEESRFGAGLRGLCWANWPLTPRSRIQFSAGYRRLAGFQRLNIETQEITSSNEVRRTTVSTSLTALHHVEGELAWLFQPKPESRWTYEFGGYYAYLVGWQGSHYGLAAITESDGRAYGEEITTELDIAKELRPYDFGLRLGVSYRLLDGLSAQLSLHKGLPDLVSGNLFTDASQNHLTGISLGFYARLF